MLRKCERKVGVAGWEAGDEKELSVLGRTITLSDDGVTMEGDDKHVGRLQEEWGMEACSAVSTPYVKPATTVGSVIGPSVDAKDMTSLNATLYRRAAAWINYVALDRPDLSFAPRVASSHMSCPKEGDELLIKRIIRYLKGKPSVAIRYKFQEESEGITVFTDSDWAGDQTTRKKQTPVGVWCAGASTP